VGYRGVSGFYDPAIPPFSFLKNVSRRREKKGRLRRDAYFPLCSPCPPCELFSRHANLKVGVPSPRSLAILPNLRDPLCCISFFTNHVKLKFGVPRRSRDIPREIGRLQVGLTKRKSAYAAITSQAPRGTKRQKASLLSFLIFVASRYYSHT